ncbi:MAG: beta-galactosidase [Patescibacteria group bacterium]
MWGGHYAKWARAFRISVLFALVISIFSTTLYSWFTPGDLELGVTFSDRYAEELGLDWQETYLAILYDLQVKKIRLPVYWSAVEPIEGQRNFETIDWMMDEAAKHDTEVTLVIGVKVPRWPECFAPDWVEGASRDKQAAAVNSFIAETVTRYKNHPALLRWQIENEALFSFGICESIDPAQLFFKVDTVRVLDPNHPIQLTASGEQSIWLASAIPADVLGVSVYQWAWNPVVGFLPIPVSDMVYATQKKLANPFVDSVIVSELQAEPWFPSYWDKSDVSKLEVYYSLFTAADLMRHVSLAERIGVDEAYLWGVEWWYYLKVHGDERLWNLGRSLF